MNRERQRPGPDTIEIAGTSYEGCLMITTPGRVVAASKSEK
jgi:hypothetical protein